MLGSTYQLQNRPCHLGEELHATTRCFNSSYPGSETEGF